MNTQEIMLQQVRTMVDAGVREGETIRIFDICNDHIVSNCPGKITLLMWKNLHEELGRAFPHIDIGTVVDVIMERGYIVAQADQQDEQMVDWWRVQLNRHRMVNGQ